MVRFGRPGVRVVSVARLPANYGTPGIPDDTLMVGVGSKLWQRGDSSNGACMYSTRCVPHICQFWFLFERGQWFEAAEEGHPAQTKASHLFNTFKSFLFPELLAPMKS